MPPSTPHVLSPNSGSKAHTGVSTETKRGQTRITQTLQVPWHSRQDRPVEGMHPRACCPSLTPPEAKNGFSSRLLKTCTPFPALSLLHISHPAPCRHAHLLHGFFPASPAPNLYGYAAVCASAMASVMSCSADALAGMPFTLTIVCFLPLSIETLRGLAFTRPKREYLNAVENGAVRWIS